MTYCNILYTHIIYSIYNRHQHVACLAVTADTAGCSSGFLRQCLAGESHLGCDTAAWLKLVKMGSIGKP